MSKFTCSNCNGNFGLKKVANVYCEHCFMEYVIDFEIALNKINRLEKKISKFKGAERNAK